MCNGTYNHSHIQFRRVTSGMRLRLQASSRRGQWCGVVSTLRQPSANAS